ncbi:MAG TPA: hypothetical protein VEK14_02945 [Rhodomicrobium sp.]|nr:hypothetical protein [Rhodomicrobium sp.]
MLLDQALKNTAPSSNAPLPSASGLSRDQNQGETHGAEDDGGSDRESAQAAPPPQQMDLFARGVAVGAPNWPERPKDVRESLLGLMMRLMLAKADWSKRCIPEPEFKCSAQANDAVLEKYFLPEDRGRAPQSAS